MDGYTYTNIFATKGIEYLGVIAFLLLLIPFWIILNRTAEVKQQVRLMLGILTENILRIPKGLSYSRHHTWTFMERSGTATVGVDDLLTHITGEVKFKHLVEPGDPVMKGEPIAQLEQEGKKLNVCSPISGTVMNFNRSLEAEPGLIADDPYGKGWLFRVEPVNWKADTADHYVAAETGNWFRNELERFRDFLGASIPKYSGQHASVILQDGGELADQPLAGLPGEVWSDFQKEFLDPV